MSDQVIQRVFALVVTCAGQAGPDVPAFADGVCDTPGLHIRERRALFDQLNGPTVLAQWPEVGKPELIPVMRPILDHELVTTSCVGGQYLRVDDLRLAATSERMCRVVAEQLQLAVNPSDDDVVAVIVAAKSIRAQLRPGEHIEIGQNILATSSLRIDSSHHFSPDVKNPALRGVLV